MNFDVLANIDLLNDQIVIFILLFIHNFEWRMINYYIKNLSFYNIFGQTLGIVFFFFYNILGFIIKFKFSCILVVTNKTQTNVLFSNDNQN